MRERERERLAQRLVKGCRLTGITLVILRVLLERAQASSAIMISVNCEPLLLLLLPVLLLLLQLSSCTSASSSEEALHPEIHDVITGGSDVQLFQTFHLTMLRAETNKHRTGVKTLRARKLPNLFVQVNVLAKRYDGRESREQYYARTKIVSNSGKPTFNQTFSYVKGVSPGFVLGTDTIFRINLYDHESETGFAASDAAGSRDVWLGMFEVSLGHEAANDRSRTELMNVMIKGDIGSAVWYSYDFTLFKSSGGLWGSDVSFNWSGGSDGLESDYGR